MANEVGDANATKQLNYTYDVYLSYRGRGTGHPFIDILHYALDQKDLKVFRDVKDLGPSREHTRERSRTRERKISPYVVKAMKESRIIIVFINDTYASTSWCLEELVRMLEFMKSKNQKVCPVFFGVDPSDVRHQRGDFGYAMAKHEDRFGRDSEKVKKWKSALVELTNLSGWDYKPDGGLDREGFYEFRKKFAAKIADWISRSLFRYDVFLSFSGKDTRYSFTGFLCNVLSREGFKTYMDDEGWLDGDQISQFHIQAIEDSKFSIIVFSENYANSPCCLDALVKILKCKELNKQRVFPIFYKVQPSDVRYQAFEYGAAMDRHELRLGKESEKVREWRSALFEVASLKGWHFESGYEYKTIQGIVELVNKALPRYDVFLSFRGRDTRNTFTGYLYYALCKKGIKTCMDDEALEGGEKISDTLINAIEESRISIIVFSENYASSSWCLDELVHILECKRQKYHLVWPIYYKVEPSDVWEQRNSYGKDMEKHENRLGKESEVVKKWRSALSDVADLEECHPFITGYEHKFIDTIVEKISRI